MNYKIGIMVVMLTLLSVSVFALTTEQRLNRLEQRMSIVEMLVKKIIAFLGIEDDTILCNVDSDCGASYSMGNICRDGKLYSRTYVPMCILKGTVDSYCSAYTGENKISDTCRPKVYPSG